MHDHNEKELTQLNKYDQYVKMVLFINFDWMIDKNDMLIMLNYYKDAYPDIKIADFYMMIFIRQEIVGVHTLEIKNTIFKAYDSQKGELFGNHYLSNEIAIRKRGQLPWKLEF